MQPQIFKTVEFPSLADVFPTYLSGGKADNLGEESPSPCRRRGTHPVFISSYLEVSNEEHPSLRSGQSRGISDLQGFPASLLLLCDMQLSAVPAPGASCWPGLGGHPASQAGLQPVPASLQGSAASTQAKTDSSPHQKELSYRNYENLGFQGHIHPTTPDTASALLLKGNLRRSLKVEPVSENS